MKIRSLLILALLTLALTGNSQPSETTYPGTVIKSGYSDDESFGPFNIGFNFTFYGNVYSQFYVNSNGQVLFGAGSADGNEAPIPTATAPNNFIAPLWDDLIISSSGKMLYTTVGAAPNRKLIIQGTNMGFYPYPIFMGTYQVVLYETTNKIQVQYRIIVDGTSTRAHGESATIGIENSTGTQGVQYSYHNATAISTGRAVSFTPSGPATYTLDPDAIYDGVVLATNLTLPEPGIPFLTSPPQDGIIGSDYTFEWSESTYAASYTLLISLFPDIGGATTYNAGTNLSFDVTGLTPGTTYYWGVFATNATGTTWCEIHRFTTSSVPPLAAIPQTAWVEHLAEKTIKLNYTGGDASAKTAIITSLPLQGQLFQYNAGVKGAQITAVTATVTDAGKNVIYVANGSTGNGAGNFDFKINDINGDSPVAKITMNVSPPGIPSLLYTAKSTTYIELQFDRIMADPTGKQNQFTITVNTVPVTINSLALRTGDQNTIIATLASPIVLTDAVTVAYIAGDVASAQGGWLASFTAQNVTLTAQLITFTINLNKKLSDSPFILSASAPGGSMTYSSSNLTVATIVGNTATFHTIGSSDIAAHQAGNGTYAPAKYTRTLTVAKGDQTISFGALANKTHGDGDYTISATASSGLSVAFASNNASVATVAGNTVHIVGAGTSTITASQAGNSLWNPAPDVPRTLTVNKANQTITFGVLSDKTYGGPDFSLSATASSVLSVSFTSGNPAIVTVTGNLVHITGVGTTFITASQEGNSNYNPAPDVQQTLTVKKADQTITFSVLSDKIYGDVDYVISATSSSLLPVSFNSGNPAVATVAGNIVHIVGAGTTVITASQPGDGTYNAAPDVQQTLAVNKADQTITFGVLPDKAFGDPDYSLVAGAGSGLSVGFTSSNSAVATVTGDLVHIVGPGTTVITASQGGDSNYNPAPDVPQTLTVNKDDQTITFNVLSDKTYGDGDYVISASAGSGLSVGFASGNTAVATIAGNTVHIVGAGTTVITASQSGDIYYNPAPDVPQTLTVNKANQTILFDALPGKNSNDPDFMISASASSGLNVVFASSNSAVATVTGNLIHITGGGTTAIIASQSGNSNFLAATDVHQQLTIHKLSQTITFTEVPEKLLVADSYTLAASSTSGLAVSFESSDNNLATVSGDQVTGVAKGTVQIRAFNDGDANYDAIEVFVDVEIYSTHKDIMYLFTPNNDGFNDLWELPEMNTWGNCDVKVYNRWGKLVYANKYYNNDWNGTSEGNPVPEGAYYFVIKTENAGVVKGTVNIVR